MEILKKEDVMQKVLLIHNKFNNEHGYKENTLTDCTYNGHELNQEFNARWEQTHIDGTMVETFGVESKYWVDVDNFTYVLSQVKYNNSKTIHVTITMV